MKMPVTEALAIAVIGFCTVILILATIAVLIIILSKIIRAIEKIIANTFMSNTSPRAYYKNEKYTNNDIAKIIKKFNENEIPLKGGEANFAADGYQHATSITKEVNVDGQWRIFKKYIFY